MMQLEWQNQPRPSLFHAAAGATARRVAAQEKLIEAIRSDANQMADMLGARGISAAAFWGHMIVLSAATDPLVQIVNTALRKLCRGSSELDSAVNAFVQIASNMVKTGTPQLISTQELETRIQPLQQQWAAYGPGLLRQIANLTDENLIVGQSRVVAVQPVFGGAGTAHLDYNAVHMEALLTNTDDRLPEVLRLAWLVAQLNNDLPMHSERIHRDRLRLISGLAMLPSVLMAAQELGLSRFDRTMLTQALNGWLLDDDDASQRTVNEQFAGIIEDWWRVCQAGNHSWNAALSALDQMIKAE